ncbi:MAG: phosphocholine cytidylyltransferase family protein [Verrucomicrobia bacterium]|nr:phosphocholine cytidylyltransferase family protein [Verrucomicrobiota bacterium]MDA1007048.1 phosphocholine cytidylyltransferase family protein [Verrucomicrobiota bacterium]
METSGLEAVILAAGVGSRLGEVAGDGPKCLLDVGGKSLLEHQFEALRGIGVERVLVVAGHRADAVIEAVGDRGEVLINERYKETNSLYSLWMARRWISGNVMILNGDVLAAPQIFAALRNAEGSVLAYDSCSGSEEEEMKVRFRFNRLQAISKELRPELSHGESLGVLRFDAAGAGILLEAADQIIRAGRHKE